LNTFGLQNYTFFGEIDALGALKGVKANEKPIYVSKTGPFNPKNNLKTDKE